MNPKFACTLRTALVAGFACAVVPLGSTCVYAQSMGTATAYPTRPIRIIVPYAPGGGNDIVGRYMAQRLTERLKQQAVVDNRAGASGIVGTDLVAKAAPDGYTLVLVSNTYTMTPATHALPYDPVRSLTAVAFVATGPNVLAVSPGLPIQSVKELVALAKARPGQLHYASSGTGGLHHFSGELFKLMAGVDIVHVPYQGGGPAMIDVMSGRVEVLVNSLISTMPHVRSGRLKLLGVSSARRASILPDLPTIAESGVPGYEGSVWWGVLGPARMTAALVNRLNAETGAVLREPDAVKWFATQGAEPEVTSSEAFGKRIADDIAKWKKVAREAGIKAE